MKTMKSRFGLLPRIIVAIVLGIALGSFAPVCVVRGVNTFSALFDQFIKFMVPLIILGLVAPAIAETGRGAGRMLLMTLAIAYMSTLASGFLGYFVSVAAFPSLVPSGASEAVKEAALTFPPYVVVRIPPMLDVMSALVFAFIAGLGMVVTDSVAVRRGFAEFRKMVTKTISAVLVPLLPFYIFGIFLDMTAAGKTKSVLTAFAAIIAISPTSYEAAQIDGAGKMAQMRYVVLPSILSTIVIMLITRVGSLLNIGYEKVLLLYNPKTYVTADVVSTFANRYGLEGAAKGIASAAEMMNNVIGMLLVIGANTIARKASNVSLY